MHGGRNPLMWAFEIEHSKWELSMWYGPYSEREQAEAQGHQIALAVAQANRGLGESRRYDHFKVVLRQVDWPTVWPLDAGAFMSADMFWSMYIQPTLIALNSDDDEDED